MSEKTASKKLANGAKDKMINNTYNDQEGDVNHQKLSNISPISRPNSGLNNPRIVRVSRAFGGKDRHSKVLTIKGLRDRRIRLSVPTAIQLYHLQDQLGLSQPSKVIDWLLNVTKDDIDELPPLQMTQEEFNRFHIPPKFEPHDFSSTQLALSPFFNALNYDDNLINGINHRRTNKGKEAMVEHNCYDHILQPSSNLSLSRFSHQQDNINYASTLPSSLSTSPFDPQLFSCFSGSTTPSFFPPYFMPNHYQFLSSSNSLVPAAPLNFIDSTQEKVPFGLNMNSKVSSQSNDNG